jgi:hypothetical protein
MVTVTGRVGCLVRIGKAAVRGIANFRSGDLSDSGLVAAILVEYGGQWWLWCWCGIVVGMLMNGPEKGKE